MGSRESQKVIEQGQGKNSFVSVLLSFSVCHKMDLDALTWTRLDKRKTRSQVIYEGSNLSAQVTESKDVTMGSGNGKRKESISRKGER